MTKKQLIVLVPLLSIVSFQIFSPIAFGADTTPITATSSAISPTVTSDSLSPTPSGVDDSPTPKPKPSTVVVPTATPIPKVTPVPVSHHVTETSLPTSTPTPIPRPTATPTPKPNIASSIKPSPTPPPDIAKTIVNFPKNVLSYIAPKNAYGASILPQAVSLEFLAIGCALVAIGMLALRWEEGDRRVTTQLKQIGVTLRSWLL